MSNDDETPLPSWLTVETMTAEAFGEMIEFIKPQPWAWKERLLAQLVDQLDENDGTTPAVPYDQEDA